MNKRLGGVCSGLATYFNIDVAWLRMGFAWALPSWPWCSSSAVSRMAPGDYLLPSNEDHRKQRSRTAPDRKRSLEDIRRMMAYTDSIGMSTSICYWVRRI